MVTSAVPEWAGFGSYVTVPMRLLTDQSPEASLTLGVGLPSLGSIKTNDDGFHGSFGGAGRSSNGVNTTVSSSSAGGSGSVIGSRTFSSGTSTAGSMAS